MFKRLFKRNQNEEIARNLYIEAVTASRQKAFYVEGGVKDTVDGRFDMITLHTCLMLQRLKDDKASTEDLQEHILKILFEDMDQALREMGVGDMSIGKQVKNIAQSFYGRAEKYEQAMKLNEADLAEVVRRNIYRDDDVDDAIQAKMVDYISRQNVSLSQASIDDMICGIVSFPEAFEVA